ncbi:MAG: amino acid adenylation domain-containing protein, partial [Sulfurovum sp.]
MNKTLTLKELEIFDNFNNTTKEYPKEKTIIEIFEEQVKKNPNNIAIIYEDIELTYQELNQKVNILGEYLRDNYQIKADTIVPIMVERSEWMIISILGVLKASGAYLPIDPEYPKERIEFMLSNSNAKLLLSDKYNYNRAKIYANDLKIKSFDIENVDYSEENIKLNLKKINSSKDLAYIIYTSGTTGRPKGVMIENRSFINMILYQIETFNINSENNIVQFASFSFDASVYETFLTLLAGASFVMLKKDKLLNNFEEVIKKYKINTAVLNPTFLTNMGNIEELKTIITAGESAISKDAIKYAKKGTYINAYGPTENSICTTIYKVDANKEYKTIPIGKPIANTKIYILNEQNQRVSFGDIGELCVGGDGLARGYLNLAELTKEKFINHPQFGRVYKTGDIAKYLSDGNIEYLGRVDEQVKIRGFRIELGEIENTFLRDKSVKEVVVLAKSLQEDSAKELIAYVVAKEKIEKEKLKQELEKTLPDYMIPSHFVFLEKFPLTPNGKIDKKALPNPKDIENLRKIIRPINTQQDTILELFEEVLGISKEQISTDDNFFDLGGHSLNAIALVSKINKALNTNITTKDIFTHRTIEKLENIISKSDEEFIYKDFLIEKSITNEVATEFDLTNVQQAYLFGREDNFEMGNIATHGYFEFSFETIDKKRLEDSFNLILDRHNSLRLIFKNGKQRVTPYKKYTIRDNYIINDKGLKSIRDRLSHKVYDTTISPLLDIEISQYNGKYIFHFSIDVLLIDGISISNLFSEWANLYNDVSYSLKPLSITFQDYILSYQKVRESKLFETAKKYWLNKIDDYDLEYNLPYKTNPSSIQKPKFVRYSKKIDKGIWSKLKDRANKEGLGVTSTLLAVYAQVLSSFSNQDNFTINLTLFNRLPLHKEIDDIYGDFTVLELFNYKRENSSLAQLLKTTHDNLWDDLDNILYDGIDFQREIRKQFNIDTSKILAPIVLTSILKGDGKGAFELEFDGYIKEEYAITQTPQVYLDNKAYEDNEGNFVAEWDYVEQIFDEATIENMHNAYCNLIEKIASSDWGERIDSLELPQKDKELITNINITEDKNILNASLPLHTLFEKQTLKTPNNVAVIDKDGKYSYEKIDNYSNSIALTLNRLNIQSDGVAIYAEKGYQQVVSTLGIMKSGKFYLPLGKSPIARVKEILTEAKVNTILVSQNYYEEIKILKNEYRVLIIEDNISLDYEDEELNTLPKSNLDDIAYVIYTSGSTGNPKGVIATHKGVSNTILAVNERFNVSSLDISFAISELSFDLSVYDIFGMLSAGGTVLFPDTNRREEPLYWCELIEKYQATIWNSVPQLANLLYENAIDNSIKLNSLKAILMSGDYIPTTLPNTIKNHNDNNIKVMSLGGATEGTIWSIWYEIEEIKEDWKTIPYGIPLPNQGIYILNRDLTPCPVGVKGDLYITGISVSLGYYNSINRTKQSFINHPTLGYIYKTGDLGILNREGFYEFSGRDDNQVKIRGFRVELGEIESKINKFEKIKDNITLVIENNGQKLLTSFIVPQKELPKEEIVQEKITIKGFLNDPIERLEFKLSQKGNRVINDEKNIKLINKKSNISLALLNKNRELENFDKLSKNISMEQISTLLNTFSNTKVDNNPLPKYYYPSAGSLYPIQIFLYIPNNTIENIEAGFYYYDRANHKLVMIRKDKNSKEYVEFYFISKLEAIASMYGPASKGFCSIEVGHIYQLFLATSTALSIGVKPIEEREEISRVLDLNENYIVTKSVQIGVQKDRVENQPLNLSLFERQSYRIFQNTTIPNEQFNAFLENSIKEFDLKTTQFKIYLYINDVELYQNGFYFYDGAKLTFISEGKLPSDLYQGRNRSIYDKSTFGLFLVAKTDNTIVDNKTMTLDDIDTKTLIDSGFYGQLLMNYSVKENIGLCPIGFIDTNPIRDYLDIKDEERVIYSFLGGAITKEQTTYWSADEDQLQEENLIDKLKKYLQDGLPSYMVPSHFIELQKLPLTANGKIDKKALPNIKDIVSVNKKIVKPISKIQKELLTFFSDVLKIEKEKISIDDNFFEIGGNSLSAISIITKISKNLQSKIELRELFSNPTIELLSAIVDKKAKIEYSPIKPITKQSDYAISNAQRRLWVLDKIQDGFDAYNETGAIEFDKPINIEILKKSLEIVVGKHEILRTNFIEKNGEPRQIISEKSSDTIFEEAETLDIDNYMKEEARKIFDLESSSLFYVKLINKNILFINIHHIICDVWSIILVIKEIATTYNLLLDDKNVNLEPLNIQYKEYTHWQNTLLEDTKYLERHQNYWHNILKEHTPLDFPLDFKRPTEQTFDGDYIEYIFNEEETNKLKDLSQDNTLFITLLTITNILFSNYSNQNDILIGTPVANRMHQDLFEQIGFYVNTLPLRNKLEVDKTFKENLLKIKNNTLDAFEYQNYPFDKLVDELDLERDISQNPLFNIMIILQNNEDEAITFGNSEIKMREIRTKTTKFDMTFEFAEVDNKLELYLEYNTNLFKKTTMQRVVQNLNKLIKTIQVNQKLTHINILSPKEESLLDSFNQTQKDYPRDKTIIELFEEQVAKNHNNIAVVYKDIAISYEELNNRANILGAYLRANYHIKPDTIIPIMFERSEWMMITILGVLKSGGAYLPIDPEYPKDRIEFMLQDSGAFLLISDDKNSKLATKYAKELNIKITNIESINFDKKVNNLQIINSSNSLAYLIYTSGSTGRPKGVMITNQNVVSFSSNIKENFNLQENQSLYAITTIAFDISVLELISSLLGNLKIVIALNNLIEDNLNEIEKNSIDIIQTTPSRFKAFLDLNANSLKNVKKMLIGGEPLNNTLLERLRELKIELYNVYGPTEATIWSSYKRVDNANLDIGKPLFNETIYILNQQNQRVPLGASGELCIAGDGLARGYLNREDLTKKVFINHPKYGRIYKTGDIAKYHTD